MSIMNDGMHILTCIFSTYLGGSEINASPGVLIWYLFFYQFSSDITLQDFVFCIPSSTSLNISHMEKFNVLNCRKKVNIILPSHLAVKSTISYDYFNNRFANPLSGDILF